MLWGPPAFAVQLGAEELAAEIALVLGGHLNSTQPEVITPI